MPKELTLTAKGQTQSDLADALREALRLIEGGFTSGMDGNESGRYWFTITGQEEPDADE